jgi:hypothetical protein
VSRSALAIPAGMLEMVELSAVTEEVFPDGPVAEDPPIDRRAAAISTRPVPTPIQPSPQLLRRFNLSICFYDMAASFFVDRESKRRATGFAEAGKTQIPDPEGPSEDPAAADSRSVRYLDDSF